MVNNRSKAATLLFGAICSVACLFNPPHDAAAGEKLNRNQIMLLNLKTAPLSAGYYIVHSHQSSKEIVQYLDNALNQIVAVDKTYAKYRKRPDDRFLQTACLKITLAKQTAQELEQQLQDAFAELKVSIDDTIITDENFPGDAKNSKKGIFKKFN